MLPSFAFKNRPFAFLITIVLLLIIWLVVAVPGILNDKKKFGTPDLRNRIVGSRIIKHKESTSPYFYKWKQNDGETFLDPYDAPGLPMNRNTITPFTLQLLQPISDTVYKDITIIWYTAEIISLLIISVLMMSLAINRYTKLIILFISLAGIGLSQGWILHNLSGQVYIFIPLLLSCLLYIGKLSPNKSDFFAAILLSTLALFRPNTLIFILPFVVLRKWKTVLFSFVLIALYFGLLIITDKIWLWQDYVRAVNLWALDNGTYGDFKSYLQLSNVKELEGSSAISQPRLLVYLEDSSIRSLVKRFLHLSLAGTQLGFLMFSVIGSFMLILFKRVKQYSIYKLFLATFLFYFISELCIPAIRNSYNSVQWVFPLAILYLGKKSFLSINILVLIGFIFATGLLKFLPYDLFISELLFAIAAFIYLIKNNTENA
jgi:hypothetical protein